MTEFVFTHHPRVVGYRGHVPDADWTFDPLRVYEQPGGRQMKPNGLWLSVNDDWRRWAEGEAEWEVAEPHHFEVDLDQCLPLLSAEDIDWATRKYASGVSRDYGYYLDWPRMASQYAGIMIAPYQWSRRLEMTTSWYYTWDCASACIWDLSVLTPAKVDA